MIEPLKLTSQEIRDRLYDELGELEQAPRFVFPVVRRVFFPQLLAQQIVSVQPMSAPTGLLFYMDYAYGGDKKPEPKKSLRLPGTLESYEPYESGQRKLRLDGGAGRVEKEGSVT